MTTIDCHYGDHRWLANGYCGECSRFNASWLTYQQQEKAEREGRAHYGHFHRTIEAKDACTRKPDSEWIEAYGDVEVPA